MIDLLGFSVLFFITCVFFPVGIILFYFKHFNNINKVPFAIVVITALGIAPAIISLIIYYLFLLIPALNSTIYFSIIVIIILGTFLYSFKSGYSQIVNSLIKSNFKIDINLNLEYEFKLSDVESKIAFSNFKFFIKDFLNKIPYYKLLNVIAFLFFGWFTFEWILCFVKKPILEHDILEYATQAKIFARDHIIEYVKFRYDENSNFIFVGLHGFSFPLLATWENIFNDVFGFNGDYFFRSLTGYYFILIYLLSYFIVRIFFKNYAILFLLFSVSAWGYFNMWNEYHLDSYRMFLILVLIGILLYTIKNVNFSNVILLGIVAGISAFSHSLSVFIVCFVCFAFFITANLNLYKRIYFSFVIGLLIIFSGGIHYLLDTILGSGWIFALESTY